MFHTTSKCNKSTLAKFMFNLVERDGYLLVARTIIMPHGDVDNEVRYTLYDDTNQAFHPQKPDRTPETAKWIMPALNRTIIDFKEVADDTTFELIHYGNEIVGIKLSDEVTIYIMAAASGITLENTL